jgi:hypothetical protein
MQLKNRHIFHPGILLDGATSRLPNPSLALKRRGAEKQNQTCFDPDGLMVITVGLKHMRGGVADAPPYTESALATDGLALGPENCWNEAVSALAQGSPIARKQTREMVFRSQTGSNSTGSFQET